MNNDLLQAASLLKRSRWGRRGSGLCMVDAVKKVAGGFGEPRFTRAYAALADEVASECPPNTNLHDWNDRQKSKRRVIRILERAAMR